MYLSCDQRLLEVGMQHEKKSSDIVQLRWRSNGPRWHACRCSSGVVGRRHFFLVFFFPRLLPCTGSCIYLAGATTQLVEQDPVEMV